MTNSAFRSAYVEKQLAIFEAEHGHTADSIRKVFNFLIEELPLRRKPFATTQVGGITKSLAFDLTSGHAISMTEIVQFSSQDGVFEGVMHPLSSFNNAIVRAKRTFPNFEGIPVGISPMLFSNLDSIREDDMWIATPPICTVAMFESMKPANDASADSSCAVLIWFQNNFGITLDVRTRQQIQDLDWSAVAVDGWF